MRIIINTFICLAFWLSIIKFSLDWKLSFFVNPVYNNMILGSWLILSISVLVLIVLLIKNRNWHLHYHYWSGENTLLVLLLVWIIWVINFIDIKPLSANTAKLRWLTQDIQSSTPSNSFGKAPEERTLIDWITMFNYNPDSNSYIWQKVNVEWFVIIDESLPEGYFYIWKTLIRCCLADAVTWVLPVRYDNDYMVVENQWVQVTWEMIESQVDKKVQSVIKALDINNIKVPDSPYES